MSERNGAERLARAWLRAIAGTSYVPMSRAELLEFLTDQARRLLAARGCTAAPVGAAVGAALVGVHLTDPVALERTLAVLDEHLRGWPPERLAATRRALAAGYARALRDRTLAGQEEIRDAVLVAQSEAEARFGAVFAAALIGIGIATTDGTIVEVNQSLADMLGYTPAELRGSRVEDYLQPDDLPRSRETYAQLLHGERGHL